MMEVTVGTILAYLVTGISSVIAWFAANKWLFPFIKEWWTKRKEDAKIQDERDLNVRKELVEIDNSTDDLYKSRVEWCLKQIATLEEKLDFKQKEIDDFMKELDNLRGIIVNLQTQIMNNKLEINKLQGYCCKNLDCKFRIKCD